MNCAIDIYGKASEILAGKMTVPPKKKDDNSQIHLHKLGNLGSRKVKLYVDIFFVNKIPFLHTKSKDIDFITIQKLTNRKATEIWKKLKFVITKNITRGVTISDVFSDNEFSGESYESMFLPATLHICSRGEHVPIIERSIRTIKQRARAT